MIPTHLILLCTCRVQQEDQVPDESLSPSVAPIMTQEQMMAMFKGSSSDPPVDTEDNSTDLINETPPTDNTTTIAGDNSWAIVTHTDPSITDMSVPRAPNPDIVIDIEDMEIDGGDHLTFKRPNSDEESSTFKKSKTDINSSTPQTFTQLGGAVICQQVDTYEIIGETSVPQQETTPSINTSMIPSHGMSSRTLSDGETPPPINFSIVPSHDKSGSTLSDGENLPPEQETTPLISTSIVPSHDISSSTLSEVNRKRKLREDEEVSISKKIVSAHKNEDGNDDSRKGGDLKSEATTSNIKKPFVPDESFIAEASDSDDLSIPKPESSPPTQSPLTPSLQYPQSPPTPSVNPPTSSPDLVSYTSPSASSVGSPAPQSSPLPPPHVESDESLITNEQSTNDGNVDVTSGQSSDNTNSQPSPGDQSSSTNNVDGSSTVKDQSSGGQALGGNDSQLVSGGQSSKDNSPGKATGGQTKPQDTEDKDTKKGKKGKKDGMDTKGGKEDKDTSKMKSNTILPIQ